ncbi:hypothetical protein [Sphingobium sp. SCG-1]|nr:hypothetical protein [Sphingobium sp. SCG-1]
MASSNQAENPRFLNATGLNVGPHGGSTQAGESVGHQPVEVIATDVF